MCVDKQDFKEFKKNIYEAIGRVKHDTGNIRTGLDAVNEHLKTLNGRTKDLEHSVENLEDDQIRGARCAQKKDIAKLTQNMITTQALSDQIDKMRANIIWVLAVIGGVVSLITVVGSLL